MTQDIILMTSKELSRYETITKLIDRQINGSAAAKQLILTVRHIRRLKSKVKQFGAKGLIHRNRGKSSNRRIDQKIIAKAKIFLKNHYSDFKPTFASEKLEERHNIKLGREKVRQIMIEEKLWKRKPRKTNKECRAWRPRKEYYGEMQQFDGSYHHWFEDRAPAFCLLASIDDATSQITQAEFVKNEGVKPAFAFWQKYAKTKGKPISIYLDRHSTYKINSKSLFDDSRVLTQFERAMKDLDIRIIHAHSPQAKGRIERLFGTLQDRLIKELRLEKTTTIEEANRFLQETFIPKFNQKFAVLAAKKKNLHQLLTTIDQANLDKIFSEQNFRTVHNDFTIKFKGQWFQLSETQPTLVLRKSKVMIEEHLNGKLFISLRNKHLYYTALPQRPQKVIKMHVTGLTKQKQIWKPPANHPWKKPFIFSDKFKTKVEEKQLALAN